MAAERPENIQKTLSEVKGQGQREEGGVKTGEVMTVVGGWEGDGVVTGGQRDTRNLELLQLKSVRNVEACFLTAVSLRTVNIF